MKVNTVKPTAAKPLQSLSRLERWAMELVPPIKIKDGTIADGLKSACDNISSPEQRLFMGVTALFTQPFIDLNNKRVSEDTRLMSFSRTLAKIIVGTTVGVIVRKECIRLASKYTKMKPIKLPGNKLGALPEKTNSFLAPKKADNFTHERHKDYINTVGTLLGIGVMMFTNFLIDAPLTQILTNIFYKNLNKDGGKNANK